MTERKTWAYRLIIEIPPECQAEDFVPEELLEKESYRDWDASPFRWPRRRLYFDWSSAQRRASMLTRWGAKVRVERAVVDAWQPVRMWYEQREFGRV